MVTILHNSAIIQFKQSGVTALYNPAYTRQDQPLYQDFRQFKK